MSRRPAHPWLWLVLMATALLSGCNRGSPAAGYFPLAGGHRWVYAQTIEWANDTLEHETVELSNEGSDALFDGPAFRRRSASGVDYWLRGDESGVFRVASKSDLDPEPKPDEPRRYVLKTPIAVGTTWQTPTTAYLLRRRQEFPPELKHSHPSFPMHYVIEATDESVDTQAGRFSHCLRVKGSASLRLFADPVVGWKDMPLTTLEWYCPDVGLVKLVREEPANSTFLTGGTLTMELSSWE